MKQLVDVVVCGVSGEELDTALSSHESSVNDRQVPTDMHICKAHCNFLFLPIAWLYHRSVACVVGPPRQQIHHSYLPVYASPKPEINNVWPKKEESLRIFSFSSTESKWQRSGVHFNALTRANSKIYCSP